MIQFLIFNGRDEVLDLPTAVKFSGGNGYFGVRTHDQESFNSPGIRKEIMTLKNGRVNIYYDDFVDCYHYVDILAASGKEIALPSNTDLDKLNFDVFIKTLYFKFGLRIRRLLFPRSPELEVTSAKAIPFESEQISHSKIGESN